MTRITLNHPTTIIGYRTLGCPTLFQCRRSCQWQKTCRGTMTHMRQLCHDRVRRVRKILPTIGKTISSSHGWHDDILSNDFGKAMLIRSNTFRWEEGHVCMYECGCEILTKNTIRRTINEKIQNWNILCLKFCPHR
jgi:hypothetical protein